MGEKAASDRGPAGTPRRAPARAPAVDLERDPAMTLLDRVGNRGLVRLLERARVQRKARDGAAPAPPATATTVAAGVGGGGRPLDGGARAALEPRFGRDFGDVRVHDDAAAARSAEQLGARAYTVGRDVVFGAGQYAPASAAGRRLLAHELAHVAQQASAPSPSGPLAVSAPHDASERAADAAADAAMSGAGPVDAGGGGRVLVQRQNGGQGGATPGGGGGNAPATSQPPDWAVRHQRAEEIDRIGREVDAAFAERGRYLEQLAAVKPESSPETEAERARINAQIDSVENDLVDWLDERIALFDADIADLERDRNDVSLGDDQRLQAEQEELQRQADRAADVARELPIKRKRARAELKDVQAKLAALPPGPTNDALKLLERQKELSEFLSSTATNRLKPGTVTRDKKGNICTVYLNEVRIGGDVGWADNNPGSNLGGAGEIGRDSLRVPNHAFSVYSSLEYGRKESSSWIDKKSPSVTIARLIIDYLEPIMPGDDDATKQRKTEQAEPYIKDVESWTKLNRNRTLGSLSPEEKAELKKAILRKESGTTSGEPSANGGRIVTCADTSAGNDEYRDMLGCGEKGD